MCICIPDSDVQVNLIGAFSDESELFPPLMDAVKNEEHADVKVFETLANRFDSPNVIDLDAADN